MSKTILALTLGMIIFSDEHKKFGQVTNVENNEVLFEDEKESTKIDPEFCHEATTEELEGNEWAANIIASRENSGNTDKVAEVAGATNAELVEDEEKM